jgi:hypothetical protein
VLARDANPLSIKVAGFSATGDSITDSLAEQRMDSLAAKIEANQQKR